VNASSWGAPHERCGGGRRRDVWESTAASTRGRILTRDAPPDVRISICAPLTVCNVMSAPHARWQAAKASMASPADGAGASLHQ